MLPADGQLPKCKDCGAECQWAWTDDGASCWGPVEAVDVDFFEEEGTMITHACKGHAGLWFGDPYVPPPPNSVDVEV